MKSFKSRVRLLEREERFSNWLRRQRFLHCLTVEQLEVAAAFDRWPEPLPSEPPPGTSPLDNLDRKTLIKQWEKHEREFAGRNQAELLCYATHGHWPEKVCADGICRKNELSELKGETEKSDVESISKECRQSSVTYQTAGARWS